MFIVGNMIASLFWGALMAVVLTAAVWLLCRVLDRASSLATYIVLLVFLLLVGAQCSMVVGAMYAKGYVTDIENYANTLLSNGDDFAGQAADVKSVLSQITDKFPMAAPIIDSIDIDDAQEYMAKGHSLVSYIAADWNSTLNYYILRRVLWIAGFILVAVIAIVCLNKPTDYSYDINNLNEIY